MLIFSEQEYKQRLQKVKDSMQEQGIEVLLVTDPANMCYLSGYNAWSFYVHQILAVFVDEEEPVWIGRYQDALVGAKKTTWLKNDNIVPYGDEYVQNPPKHPMSFVAKVIEDMGKGSKTVGVEMDNYYFTAQCYVKLQEGLPNARFVNGDGVVNWVRIIKSDQEIDLMKKAARIVEKTMDELIDYIEPGVRECDASALIYRSLVEGTSEFGGDYPAIVPLMPSGENTGAPHLTWTDRKYDPNDAVIIEIAGCHNRYHSPLARTVVLGEPTKKMQETSDIVVEGLNNALEVAKPGVTCEEVEAAWRETLNKYNLEKESRIGYATGLNFPPDWGEHSASLRPGDKTVLKPNMTFHMIPGMWFDDFGIEISETFRVTENGCETLADYPRKLFKK